MVTVGASVALDPSRKFFGLDRLRASLSDGCPRDVDPQELVRRLRDDVQRFTAGAEAADDITLLAVRWYGAPAG